MKYQTGMYSRARWQLIRLQRMADVAAVAKSCRLACSSPLPHGWGLFLFAVELGDQQVNGCSYQPGHVPLSLESRCLVRKELEVDIYQPAALGGWLAALAPSGASLAYWFVAAIKTVIHERAGVAVPVVLRAVWFHFLFDSHSSQAACSASGWFSRSTSWTSNSSSSRSSGARFFAIS